jgi:hypothetical protein
LGIDGCSLVSSRKWTGNASTWAVEEARLKESVSFLEKSKDELAISKGKADASLEGDKAQWRNERAELEKKIESLKEASQRKATPKKVNPPLPFSILYPVFRFQSQFLQKSPPRVLWRGILSETGFFPPEGSHPISYYVPTPLC